MISIKKIQLLWFWSHWEIFSASVFCCFVLQLRRTCDLRQELYTPPPIEFNHQNILVISPKSLSSSGDYDAHDYWPVKTFEILTTGQLHNCIALNIVLEHCTTYCNSCLNPSLSVFINNFVFINNLLLIKSFVFINDFVFISNFDDKVNIIFINNFSTTLQLLDCWCITLPPILQVHTYSPYHFPAW